MTWLLLTLMLANPERVTTLLDGVVAVGPGKIRHMDVNVPRKDASIECAFRVQDGRSGVRVAVIPRKAWDERQRTAPIADSGFLPEGRVHVRPQKPGQYVLLVESPDGAPSTSLVQLRVDVKLPNGSHADPARAQIVVWTSAAIFLMAGGWAGLRIKRAVEARNRHRILYYY